MAGASWRFASVAAAISSPDAPAPATGARCQAREPGLEQPLADGGQLALLAHALRLELKGHLYKLAHENVPTAPFFRVD